MDSESSAEAVERDLAAEHGRGQGHTGRPRAEQWEVPQWPPGLQSQLHFIQALALWS